MVRQGGQAKPRRVSGAVNLTKGDKLKLELIVTGRSSLSVGLLEQTGEYVPMVDHKTFEAGTHALADAKLIESRRISGLVVVGDALEVSQALRKGQIKQLVSLRIGWKVEPLPGPAQPPAPSAPVNPGTKRTGATPVLPAALLRRGGPVPSKIGPETGAARARPR